MAKQKLEAYFKDSVLRPDVWCHKIFNNHYTTTPADFIVLTHDNKYLVECKQTDYNERYYFDRLTQVDSLLEFEVLHSNNHSIVVLMFWNKRLKNSKAYIMSITDYINMRNRMADLGYKSISVDDMRYYDSSQLMISHNKFILNGYFR